MSDNDTRRDYMKYGGTIAVGGMLAGCAGDNTGAADDTPESSDNEETSNTEETESDEPEEWSVTLEPSGTMTFEKVPKTFATYHPGWADIMASLGQLNRMAAVRRPEENFPTRYYEQIPGIDISHLSEVMDLFPGGADSADKEVFYEVEPDISIIDPGTAKTYLDFDESDIKELESNVAPFFGSDMRRGQLSENHPYYTLFEGVQRIAQVFRVEERAEELQALYQELISTVELPSTSEREWETYFIGHGNWWGDFSEFYPAQSTAAGYNQKPYRDLGFKDEDNAFIDIVDWESYAPVDKELFLEADPDIIIWYGGTLMNEEGGWDAFGTQGLWEEDVVEPLKQDPVLSEVTAVQEDRIYPTGTYGGGPVKCLFVVENVAKAMFPEQFGEYRIGEYPEEEWVFDRHRLADIINGDL